MKQNYLIVHSIALQNMSNRWNAFKRLRKLSNAIFDCSQLSLNGFSTYPPIQDSTLKKNNILKTFFFQKKYYLSVFLSLPFNLTSEQLKGNRSQWSLKVGHIHVNPQIGHAKSCLYYALYILCQHCHLCPLSLTKCLFNYVQY